MPNKITNIVILDILLHPVSPAECTRDYLNVFEMSASVFNYNRSLLLWCGHSIPEPVSSTFNLSLVFVTDNSRHERGFKFVYFYSIYAEIESTFIKSPNYPWNYPYQSNYNWTVSPRRYSITKLIK
ncbi:cubilin-like [Physella acuta]|uniref:cubilin-like n=1 Tax=Physella acuta TaxID=109671 RepID=UPI0027DD3330|nr:cubilin-like [Physella acuta]